MPDQQTTEFLNHLSRGGEFGHYWTPHDNRSTWYAAGDPPKPNGASRDTYFGVNPVRSIPTQNSKGQETSPARVRSQNEFVCAINCFFGDFDAKDFGSKQAALDHITALPVAPSVIVDSGGGYHGYWLLDEPYTDMERAEEYLVRWVAYTKADKQVKDLSRILRVPGTRNLKYNPAALVSFVKCDLSIAYPIDYLTGMLPDIEPEPEQTTTEQTTTEQPRRAHYWAQAIETAVGMIHDSPQGEKHSGLLRAARLLGGYVGGGIGNSDEAAAVLESAIGSKPGVTSLDLAKQTIADGLAYGIAHPITYEQKERERATWIKEHTGGEVEKRRPSRKLTSANYHSLFKAWGYDIRLNLCNDDVTVNGEILTDQVEAAIRQQVRDYAINADRSASVGATEDSIRTMASKRCYHPVKDYLDGLEWDGDDYFAALLSHFKGDGFLDRWLDTWLPGAVARVYEGWQNPMLVLDGDQGLGKSFLAQWLCSPLPKMFVESPLNPDYKDHRLRLIQTFIWEVQELGATTRKADQDALKAFITLGTVRERKSYGKRDIQKPVICSFFGTINNDAGFLTDLTGNRRYLVTHLDSIDWGYSDTIDVDQIWAQAVAQYRLGDQWKMTRDERETSEEQNARFMVSDPVELFLEDAYNFTGKHGDIVVTSLILDALQTDHNLTPTKSVTMRVASVLRSWGAQKDRATVGGKQVRVYRGITYR